MAPSKESLSQAKHKLEELDKKDAERRRTAELKNNLEGYIYATKEKVRTFALLSHRKIPSKNIYFFFSLLLFLRFFYVSGFPSIGISFNSIYIKILS
jgi:hypothetical protein